MTGASVLGLMANQGWTFVNAFHTKTTNAQGTALVPATMYVFSRPKQCQLKGQ